MGIKLDWQVESEQSNIKATEDPQAQLRRRQARRQLILLLLLVVCLLSLAGAAVIWRLQQVDDRIRQDLLDTIAIEVTALRIGDFANYMAIQRSASDAFLLEQSHRFEEYQQLKEEHRVQLTGRVVSATIDNQRGRAVIEEIIDGVPYHVVWFYWRYEDSDPTGQGGWRHVPDDLTFWGEESEISSEHTRIKYRTLDESLAHALLPELEQWWSRGCAIVSCAVSPPAVMVAIVPERPPSVDWAPYDPWTLRVSSPLVSRARADQPLTPELRRAIVDHLAARMVRYATGDAPISDFSDAAWLATELSRWLAAEMMGQTLGETGFIESMIAHYGAGAPLTLLTTLHADTTLDEALSAVTGVSMPLLTVDQLNDFAWEDFFQWRLGIELQLLAQPSASGAFMSLYDLQNIASSSEASLRLENPAYSSHPAPDIVAVTITRDENSQTYAYAETTRTENGITITGETVIWRLSNGTWKRTN